MFQKDRRVARLKQERLVGDDKYLVGEKTESINLVELEQANEINNEPADHVDEPGTAEQPEASKPHDKALFENLLEDSNQHQDNNKPQPDDNAETDTESEKEPLDKPKRDPIDDDVSIIKPETGTTKLS